MHYTTIEIAEIAKGIIRQIKHAKFLAELKDRQRYARKIRKQVTA